MEERKEDNLEDKINAGRGVAKVQNTNSNKNTTLNQEDDDERLDDRARKAGY